MNLQDEIFKKFSVSSKDNLLNDTLTLYKKSPQTEKTLREAFVNSAAILLHDKELIFEGKPLLIRILEMLTKLCALVINNKEYNEQFAVYVIMCLADYIELLSHDLIPLELFKQLPVKNLQLTILAQPKLPTDWTLSEINDLIIEFSKNIKSKEEGLLALARINLAMRLCKAKQIEKCKDQLLILSKSSNISSVATDLIDDYLLSESSQADVQAIAAIFQTNKELSLFYQQCISKAASRFQHYQTQSDSDLLTRLLIGENATLKQLLTNSISPTTSNEINVDAKRVTTTEKSSVQPPPIPPRAKVPELPARTIKKESKVKTMSRIAARQMGAALRKRSGYEEKSPLENKPIENKPIENKPIENKPIEDNRSLTEVMIDAFSKRRDRIKVDESDEESDKSWNSDDEIITSPTTKTTASRPLPPQPSAAVTSAAPPALSRSSNSSRPSVMTLFGQSATDIPLKPPAAAITQQEAIKSPKKDDTHYAKRK